MKNRLSLFAGLALACLVAPVAVSSQTVLVRVTDGQASRPMFGALAYLVDGGGQTAMNSLTDERGRALFVGLSPGSYSVRVEMIGMASAVTDVFDVAEGITVTRDMRLESSAIQLEGIEIELDGGRCQVRPDGEGLLVSQVKKLSHQLSLKFYWKNMT